MKKEENRIVIEICNLLLNVGAQAEYLRHVHLNMIDYSGIIMSAYKTSEDMTSLILMSKMNCRLNRMGMIESERFYDRNPRGLLPITFAIQYAKDYFPKEIIELMRFLRGIRNESAHTCGLTEESFFQFCNAFDRYTQWFIGRCKTLDIEPGNIDMIVRTYESARRCFNPGKSKKENESELLKEIARSITALRSDIQDLKDGQEEIKGQLAVITEQIRYVSERINDYQGLVEKQLARAVSKDETERIIDSFSEECTQRIVKEVKSVQSTELYERELKELKASFGETIWNRLSTDTKTFLVTAKVSFKTMLSMDNLVDYSGVCLLVTKALEYEIKKRFYSDYLNYLRIHYPGVENYNQYPTPLMKNRRNILPPEKFTLGNVAFVLGYCIKSNETSEQTINNQNKLVEYCQSCLFAGKDRAYILRTLLEFAETIEGIRNDYRNPSAHTNAIRKENAEDCINLVIDIEKFLKKMIESFDR